MAELTNDIATYLIGRSIAGVTAIGTNVFLDFMPDAPDNILGLIEYAGVPPDIPIDLLDRRVQIMARSDVYATARTMAYAVFNALDKGSGRGAGVALTLTRKAVINAIQSPFYLGPDERGRHQFVFNVAVATTRD